MLSERRYTTFNELTQVLGRLLAEELRAQLARGPKALLIVPGGTTPAPIFAALRETSLPWARTFVTLCDERWIAPPHADSNETLVREHLMRGPAQAADFVPLYRGQAQPSAAIAELSAALAPLPIAQASVLLGMGEDGHFASLFPHMENLGAGLDPRGQAPCLAVDAPQKGWPRISLTLSYLCRAPVLHLAFRGQAKHALLERGGDLPIHALLRQEKADIVVHWTE
ncbi:MAG TPA: 6-phosphogluconolactonase [Dongiaceae bacterium]|jgi:6-phosphogluconolactonase|nr:6-phosphogluconolactonase [Dongiaceae bacterium]